MEMNVLSGPDILVALGLAILVFFAWVIRRCCQEFIGALRRK